VTGRRLPNVEKPADDFPAMEPGDYVRYRETWFVVTPNGHAGNLRRHRVTEHEDGTITVAPSILVSAVMPESHESIELWHGFLERGVWRSV
jgi:hypothetical protein